MKTEVAVFGGGCFWCTEAIFKMLKGVTRVEPGYAGGTTDHPTYEDVCSGTTGHVEVVRIEYDPTSIRYRDLLTVFFGSHDATQVARQGNDVGEQYRSVVFYANVEQKKEADTFIAELNASAKEGAPLATTVEPLSTYFVAEDYHKNYYTSNKGQNYCQAIIAPKLQKVQKEFAALLRAGEDVPAGG